MKKRSYKLLKKWLDTLLAYQLKEIEDSRLKGCLICPACGVNHGRIYDLMYPLALVYKTEKDEKYLNSAREIFNWSENNIVNTDGLYFNDWKNEWFGISFFAADSYYEALKLSAFPEDFHNKIAEAYKRLCEALEKHGMFTRNAKNKANINYYCGGVCVMAQAYEFFGEEKYLNKANELKCMVLERITPDKMLLGESYHSEIMKSKGGFYSVDIGYNLEESIPFLIKGAVLLNDIELLKTSKDLMREGLKFILPDGGMDNTWGVRSAKWTYYGSRTSDGLACGLALCPDEPMFVEAMYRNLLQFEDMTVNGLLAGGKMYREAEEPICIHHSFTHIKALCAIFESGIEIKEHSALPQDSDNFIYNFPYSGVTLVGIGDIRASVKKSDVLYNEIEDLCPQGGSLTLLYSKKLSSPILAATQNTDLQVEITNMQGLKNGEHARCMSMRIETDDFKSNYETDFTVNQTDIIPEFEVKSNTGKYNFTYSFKEDGAVITATSSQNGKLILPLVCKKDEEATLISNGIVLTRERGNVTVETDGILTADTEIRHFNPCGGFLYCICEIELNKNQTVTVKITID